MNAVMIRHLVAKDVNLYRAPTAAAMAGGVLALGMTLWSDSRLVFYIGSVLFITVVISTGIYIAFLSVLQERTKGMMPYVMSLPIGVREYTAAKLVANGVLFLVPWMALGAGAAGVILVRDSVPDGLLPYAMLLLLHMLTGYVLTLAAALITGSEGWTITVMGVANLGFNVFMFWAASLNDIAATIGGPIPVWTSSIRWLISAEILAVLVILAITWAWQARRTDFT